MSAPPIPPVNEVNADSSIPESRVLIIGTGGTICMQPSVDGLLPMGGFLEKAMAPRPSFNDMSKPAVSLKAVKDGKDISLLSLRTPPTAYSRHVRYSLLEFSPLLDSSSISAEGWGEIAQTIKDNYHLYDGFVILHGTDSLAYSASALSFITTKSSATNYNAFESLNCEPLAKINGLGVDVNWGLIQRPKRIAEFQITKSMDTANVTLLWVFPGIRPEMVDSVLRTPGLRGLILASFGMGNAPHGIDGSFTRVIREGVERGIVIVNVSQCPSGFVSPVYGPGTQLGRAGVIFGLDLTIEAALTKLSYLLAIPGITSAEVSKRMAQSIRGEMTEKFAPVFEHPAGNIDSAVARLSTTDNEFTALGYAIRNNDLRTVTEILDGDEVEMLKKSDYAGNTAVHLAAVCTNVEILRLILVRGGNVHTRNRANNTALFVALNSGNVAAANLLREAGAHLWESPAPPPTVEDM
ncbi:L-asparaginase [Ceratocystis platani]|uniref:asparaginase n=1 Tax=Ceratocystis fimbriata f. sp. platani TaxID=88771 RepID=A0A0F8DCB6_CERFI|nr:L-asparaginase [Ceratocystis platani]